MIDTQALEICPSAPGGPSPIPKGGTAAPQSINRSTSGSRNPSRHVFGKGVLEATFSVGTAGK